MRFSFDLAGALADAGALLLPVRCAGCGRAGRSLCRACRSTLADAVHRARRGELEVWCALDYAGAARNAIAAFKDGGRVDLARPLARALRDAILAALADTASTGVELVSIPSSARSWRRRGYRPVDMLVRRAGFRAPRVLRHRVRRRDQVGLGRAQRMRNVAGTLGMRRGIRSLEGRRFLLVDDIVTTGSTLLEAARVLREAGAEVIGAAVVADTRRWSERSADA
ncbi:phosphoribosyltransferase family protein [Rathayibacter sp. YIM 133350]|uniref:ComF family protein n=1 Tax=Rathayibacter sp. YIM 133350 TaxID=3131992 RepID=UPI00307CED4E